LGGPHPGGAEKKKNSWDSLEVQGPNTQTQVRTTPKKGGGASPAEKGAWGPTKNFQMVRGYTRSPISPYKGGTGGFSRTERVGRCYPHGSSQGDGAKRGKILKGPTLYGTFDRKKKTHFQGRILENKGAFPRKPILAKYRETKGCGPGANRGRGPGRPVGLLGVKMFKQCFSEFHPIGPGVCKGKKRRERKGGGNPSFLFGRNKGKSVMGGPGRLFLFFPGTKKKGCPRFSFNFKGLPRAERFQPKKKTWGAPRGGGRPFRFAPGRT